LDRNRRTSAVSPTILAAVRGPAPADLEQNRRQFGNQVAYFGVELVDLGGEGGAALEEPAGETGHGAVQSDEVGGHLRHGLFPVERPHRRVPCRVELVEVPAEPADDPGPFRYEVFTVVDQQAQLAGGPVELGGGQVGLLEGGAGDRDGVDRVGFPVITGLFPGSGHHLGRDPHHSLAGAEQVAF
jgi:hypothetical protein